jgi:hypothetical protein
VGIYFVTQYPIDVPDTVLGQLGNRVQHALRAFTPRDQKAVRVAATTMRSNPKIDTEKVITELGVGEALVSFLDEKGQPGIVERAFVLPPHSQIGPITPEIRRSIIASSYVYGHYERIVDRESAYEKLKEQAAEEAAAAEAAKAERPMRPAPAPVPEAPTYREPRAPRPVGRPRDSMLDAFAKSATRAIGSQIGRQVVRGILGSILGGRR